MRGADTLVQPTQSDAAAVADPVKAADGAPASSNPKQTLEEMAAWLDAQLAATSGNPLLTIASCTIAYRAILPLDSAGDCERCDNRSLYQGYDIPCSTLQDTTGRRAVDIVVFLRCLLTSLFSLSTICTPKDGQSRCRATYKLPLYLIIAFAAYKINHHLGIRIG